MASNQRYDTLERLFLVVRYSEQKKEFLDFLRTDLHRIGVKSNLRRTGNTLRLCASLHTPKPARILKFMKQERLRRLEREKEFIRRMENSGVSKFFANGSALKPCEVKPRLHFCRSRGELDLFRFCRLMQSVPAPGLLYRQLAVLVRDDGLPGLPVIGIFGLSSTIYSLGCRDHFFGWIGSENKNLKTRGLESCMQLSICMALPPYSYLRAGRLMAALAASDAVADEFSRRYTSSRNQAQLRAIITTCATGLHSPIFNRIMLCPGGLYRRIGQTIGYSTLFFSKETLAAARRVVVARDGICPATTDRPMRTLKRALSICKLPRESLLRLGIPKGVYLAVGGKHSLFALRTGSDSVPPSWPSVQQILNYWRSRDLPKALANDVYMRKARSFRNDRFLKTVFG